MRASRAVSDYQQKEGRPPDLHELAAILQVEPEQAAQALEAGQLPLSLTAENEEGESQIDIAVESESFGSGPKNHLPSVFSQHDASGNGPAVGHDSSTDFPQRAGYPAGSSGKNWLS